jgi:hypothetical protein
VTNLLEQAIACDDGDQAAKMIQHALGIESDDVLNYTFPKDCPTDREVRARIIGGGLQAEARYADEKGISNAGRNINP